VQFDALPCSAVLARQPDPLRQLCGLYGGDDYELLFSAPPADAEAVIAASRRAGVAVTRIGRIEAEAGLRVFDGTTALPAQAHGFDHFG
jgi:thiamine-monophosphate kinase